jgi:hypothetical protein
MMGGTAAAGTMGPSWLAGAFAAVMIVTAVYCAGRIIAARRWRRPTGYDIDAVHVLMGTAMAGMLVPGLRFGPAGGWEIVFGAAAGWFGWRAWRGRGPAGHRPAQHRPAQHVQHLLASLAMLYMLLAVGPAASRAAGTEMGGSTHLRTLALVLALALLGCVINSADRLTALPLAAGTAPARTAPPALTAAPPARTAPPASAATVTAPPAPAGPARPGAPASPAEAPVTARTPALSPRLAACCDIAMGVTMGYLLVLMVSV